MNAFWYGRGMVVMAGIALVGPALGQTYTQIHTIEYFDEPTTWVIGLEKRRTIDGIESERTDYGWKSLPWKTYKFGALTNTLAYNSTATVESGQLGALRTITDGRGNTTTLSEWKYGVPQLIQYPATPEAPAGAYQRALVDTRGFIVEVTDEARRKTCYAYDQMGRVTQITYPSETVLEVCDQSKWHITTQAFGPVASVEYGIAAGHWRRTVRTGNALKFEYYDALWRPLLTREMDATSASTEASTVRFQRFAYDKDGRPTFSSYPGSTSSLTAGTWTSYDLVGRTTSVSQDSELGLLTHTSAYGSDSAGIYSIDTSPKNQQTKTWYQAFGEPTFKRAIAVNHPEGAYTTITRDTFGKPMSIRRANAAGSVAVVRQYAFDANQRLCRSIEPESGATLYGYDAGGNLSWSAAGLPAGTACSASGQEANIVARKVQRSYDARNRIGSLAFADGFGDTVYAYHPNGSQASLVTHNGWGNYTTNSYTYDSRRNVLSERLQWGGDDLSVSYGYDAHGSLSSKTLPSSLSLSYAPNALGQPTQVGSFATAIAYYPSGVISSFRFGNGITHSMTLNARQLPARSMDCVGAAPCSGAQQRLDFGYTYDRNGNIASIIDNAAGSQSRSLTYDGRDRLTAASSTMFGNAAYTYDVLDNISTMSVGGGVDPRSQYYVYVNNRLVNVKDSNTNATVVGLDYDERGNLSIRNGVTYVFDHGNRLRSADGQEGGYVYDGHGRRVSSVVGTMNPRYRTFFYDSVGRLIYERSSASSSFTENIHLQGSLIATRSLAYNIPGAQPVISYKHTDMLGSPVLTTSPSQVAGLVSHYEPYGKLANRVTGNEIGFTGHSQDAATGLTYMQQRYYDPSIGRFLSVDPVTAYESGGTSFNRYWYADDNPYMYTDPDGRQSNYMKFMDMYMRNYYRNVHNKPPPNREEAGRNEQWRRLPLRQSLLHVWGEGGFGNTKYVDETGQHEAVYNSEGELITDTLNGGTYNYVSPDDTEGHFYADVLPYLLFGNGPIEISFPQPEPQQPETPAPAPERVPTVKVGQEEWIEIEQPPPPPPPEEQTSGFRR